MAGHDFTFEGIDGDEVALSNYQGRPVLVVNVASECGFTPQYNDLQQLWEEYRDDGLVVLGVPSNDFGGQEPGSEDEIKDFCTRRFGVDFPLTAKQTVIGGDAHPFYRWVEDALGEAGTPKWNFHKYLIGPDGRFLDWFSTKTEPTSAKIVAAIEAALPRS